MGVWGLTDLIVMTLGSKDQNLELFIPKKVTSLFELKLIFTSQED